jgi:hypothetical protein
MEYPKTPVGGFVIPRRTELRVRVDEVLGTDRNSAGILKGRARLILG